MDTWANQLARRIKPEGKSGEPPVALLGKVITAAPLKLSLFGGEIFAPPMQLLQSTVLTGLIQADELQAGDRVICVVAERTCVAIDKVG